MGILDIIEKIISILTGLVKLISAVLKLSEKKSKKDPSGSLPATDESMSDDEIKSS